MADAVDVDHCATPEWLYKALDAEFRFDLDPCPLTVSPQRDGLALDWTGRRVFCNPPYSKIEPWVQKAFDSQALTVFLVPGRIDAKWSRILREGGATLRPFCRTVNFEGLDGKRHKPMGGSMVAIVNRLYK